MYFDETAIVESHAHIGPGRTMANLLKCPEFLRTCLTPKMSETSLRYRVLGRTRGDKYCNSKPKVNII